MKNNNSSKRQLKFELMRIISMFMIVLWHIMLHGGVLYSSTGVANVFVTLLFLICTIHVNSFVLVTGYFQYNKDMSVKKVIKIFNAQWFYRVVIVILMVAFEAISLSKLEILKNIGPFDLNNYWFIRYYIVLYLISPFLNKLIKVLKQSDFRKLILLMVVLFSIIPTITANMSIPNTGFTIVNFILLYFIGAYLKKYPIRENYHFSRFSKNKIQLIAIFGFIGAVAFNFALGLSAKYLATFDYGLFTGLSEIYLQSQFWYSQPLILIQSIFYFMFFETLNVKHKIFKITAPFVLGIYLIHDNYMFKHFYMPHLLDFVRPYLGSLRLLVIITLFAVGIFIICMLIEVIRQAIFKFIENRKISRKISSKVNSYFKNI